MKETCGRSAGPARAKPSHPSPLAPLPLHGELLAERERVEVLGHQDAPQVGVPLEPHAEHVEGLALEPVRPGPERRRRGDDGVLLGAGGLHAEPLVHLHAVAIDIRVPVEFDIDDGQSDAGDRAHPRHARHAVHLGLDRKGDELLDLGGRKTFGLDHDRDGRPVEIGQHVDRQPRDDERAVEHQHGRHRQHQEAIAQRLGDKDAEHGQRT